MTVLAASLGEQALDRQAFGQTAAQIRALALKSRSK
jgi:hypothetical protein